MFTALKDHIMLHCDCVECFNSKAASLTDLAVHADISIILLNDCLCKGKPDAIPFLRGIPGSIAAVEAVEEM